ncbi:putative protein TPRXL [Olea europaea var. sylvestris]|uniref:putative protein TPRXL n=1 Tax=Olea europaea var. sylvestris TaxID=158386 RepID=UPI000C1D25D9|nr:putative protein TPRXL [Olea europaea var. sylvestris]
MEFFSDQESSHGIKGDKKALDSVSSPSSSPNSSDSSESEDIFEEVNSSGSSSSSPTCGSSESSSSSFQPLQDMSSLLQELPVKRGLSRHYNGKSQSFTSLSNVRALEDLAKPENPYKKKLKSCKSYGGLFLERCSEENPQRNKSSSRFISKKIASRGSCSSLLSGKRTNYGFIRNRPSPPIPRPQRSASSSSFANQAPLFA